MTFRTALLLAFSRLRKPSRNQNRLRLRLLPAKTRWLLLCLLTQQFADLPQVFMFQISQGRNSQAAHLRSHIYAIVSEGPLFLYLPVGSLSPFIERTRV